MQEEASLIPESGRSPGGEKCNPLQYSCLENPMDRRWAGVALVCYSSQAFKGSDTTETTEHR